MIKYTCVFGLLHVVFYFPEEEPHVTVNNKVLNPLLWTGTGRPLRLPKQNAVVNFLQNSQTKLSDISHSL